MQHIRNFSIIAHIDHGKSTLADRFLELTGTIEKRKMREQVLDSMELERERGITIKMQPVRMVWKTDHSHRGTNAERTRNDAENTQQHSNHADNLLYEDLTYKIRGVCFELRKKIGLGHKEQVYHSALEIALKKAGLSFESKKNIPVVYEGKNVGMYQPDFVVDGKVLLELKALPEIGTPQTEQLWSYLKGCDYKLALLVNFGSKELDIKRVVYDTARQMSSVPRDSASSRRHSAGVSNQIEYVLNLIDTPGHIDFSYEVSRALTAVEGAILLVDATQGVQAQTLTTLRAARELGLVIVPAVSKIDSPLARVADVKEEVAKLLEISPDDILECSGRTGEGVEDLLQAVIDRVPPPKEEGKDTRALIFDFQYSDHQGVIVYLRVFGGAIRKGEKFEFAASGRSFNALEVGTFAPKPTPAESLDTGFIGYVVTGIKEPGVARVGDTVRAAHAKVPPLSGYAEPRPVVWASLYPESQDDFTRLRMALSRLRLSDSSLSFEEESSGVLGRGFRCGFLGMLHLEIVTERMRREFSLGLVVTTPTITYEVETKDGKRRTVYSPSLFPEHGDIVKVWEPYVAAQIVVPSGHLGPVTQVLFDHEAVLEATETFSEGRVIVKVVMPLRELMRNFFDKIKTVSSGYASVSYDLRELREADVARLDILVAEEPVPAFTRIVASHRAYEEAVSAVEKLYKILPRQMFATKIQGQALGRILSSKTLSAMSKDVTQHMYGGDITRKMKLREKQKKGKKKMLDRGRVNIPEEVFMKMVKSD